MLVLPICMAKQVKFVEFRVPKYLESNWDVVGTRLEHKLEQSRLLCIT